MNNPPSRYMQQVARGTLLAGVAAIGLVSILATGGGGGSSRVPPSVNYSVLPTTALVMSTSAGDTSTTDAALAVAVIQLDTRWIADLMIESVFPFSLSPYSNAPCPGGGISSLLVSMLNPTMFSIGDSYTLSFNGCVVDNGVIFDGSMTVTLLAVGDLNNPADPPLPLEEYFIGSRVQLIQHNLAVSDATGLLVSDGDMTFAADDSPGYVRFAASGNSVAESDGLRTARMTDYELWTGTDAVAAIHASTDYTLADTLLGGIIQAATPAPFTTASLDTYPTSGTLTVTGQDGNGVRLTTLNNTNVQLDYEFDGDGTFDDYPLNSTWAAVSAFASIPLGLASQPAPQHPALPALRALKAMGS